MQFHRFDTAERDRRLDRIWSRMHGGGVAALVLTSDANFRYVAGFRSPTWVSVTRPRFLVLGRGSLPVLIVPESNRILAAASGWASDIRTWPAPRPYDDGISLLLQALQETAPTGRIGFEIGLESRIGFPAVDFLRVVDGLGRERIADAAGIVHATRAVKSPDEQQRHRLAAAAASKALARLSHLAPTAATDIDLRRLVQSELLECGAETVPYCVCATGAAGYSATNTEPDGRALRSGDVLYVDVGATVDGYFSDINRNIAIGAADETTRAVYRTVHRALDAGIRCAAPGVAIRDVWTAMARILAAEGGESGIGRLGHSIGLSLTEPPSISADADTLLEAGMVLAIEPSVTYAPANEGGRTRLMVHEENILIVESGCALLTTRAEPELQVA